MERIEQREGYIRRIRTASLLDAVFLLFYYNEDARQWGSPSERPPVLDWRDVLPAVSQPTYEYALTLTKQMWEGRTAVGLAVFKYPQAKRPFKEELVAFKAGNPGFSEQSYDLAIQTACIELR